ncbi:MAG: hypothetical protein MJE68_09105 [Proteobacteria bacterium]|nr:hypothetical protein [Pseudomonadota bacterium]
MEGVWHHDEYNFILDGFGLWQSGNTGIPTSQNRSTWSAYTDVPIFLVQKNTKNFTVSIFIRYNYADTVPSILARAYLTIIVLN